MSRTQKAAILLSWLVFSCKTATWRQKPHDVLYQKVPPPVLHERPEVKLHSSGWQAWTHGLSRPLGETLSPGHYYEKLAGTRQARDINAFGEVIDSPWFENRMGKTKMTPTAVARGPNQLLGPAPGKFVILGGKLEGATPGLVVADSQGIRFLAKFDAPAFPELSSGAEVIATKILYAAGYHVPENYLMRFKLQNLWLSGDAQTKDKYGQTTALDRSKLEALLTHVNPFPDGTVRALFSRFVPGEIVGRFLFRGVRHDDPNDRLSHERRRSLRALGVFYAWLHNVDAGSANTLDVFIRPSKSSELGYLRHYIIDFGDALGAAGTRPKYIGEGYAHRVDWSEIGRALFSLGAYYPRWLPVLRSPFRSVGVYEADIFELEHWRPNVSNPAFTQQNDHDVYWAASIISRFSPDHLAAVVKEAQYSEPGATEWVLRVLTERQYKILNYAFSRVLPLARPRSSGWSVKFTDLAVKTGLRRRKNSRYTWAVRWNRTQADDLSLGHGVSKRPRLDLTALVDDLKHLHGPELHKEPFVSIRFRRASEPTGPATDLHVRVDGSRALLVGLDRLPGS